jgi:hypothetical protein
MSYRQVSGGLSPARVLALVLGLVGAAACAIGAAMTWVKIEPVNVGPFDLGTASFSGLSYPVKDGLTLGQVSLIAGVVAAVAILLAQIPACRWFAIAGFISAAIAGLAAYSFRDAVQGDTPEDVIDVIEFAGRTLAGIELGPGTTVVLAGSALVAIGSVVTLVTRRSSVAVMVVTSPQVRPSAAPGWLRDPTGRFELRYWDGRAWTDHVATAGVTGRDGPTMPSTAVTPPPRWAAELPPPRPPA